MSEAHDNSTSLQLEPDPKLTELLLRTRRQTLSWYLRSTPVVIAGALATTILAMSVWFEVGSSSLSPAHHHLTTPADGTAPPTVAGIVSTPHQRAPRSQ